MYTYIIPFYICTSHTNYVRRYTTVFRKSLVTPVSCDSLKRSWMVEEGAFKSYTFTQYRSPNI